jgi:hypothetical protein
MAVVKCPDSLAVRKCKPIFGSLHAGKIYWSIIEDCKVDDVTSALRSHSNQAERPRDAQLDNLD